MPMEILHNSFFLLTGLAIFAKLLSEKVLILAADDLSVTFTRSSFPDDFVFGTSSASYQFEGAAKEGGKGPSIWDTFTHEHPEKIMGQTNGDVALDFYHRYKEDISKVKYIGMDAFRISISWPRILPRGKLSGGVNQEGINFYNNLIDELISNGIKPFVTLFHWDLPQALEDEYEGFLHDNIVNDYLDYADICFKEFGDRVKHWMTFNEPLVFIQFGYEQGVHAPGRCSNYLGRCDKGNSGKEPYLVVHNQLLCHAAAVKLYREKYKKSHRGEIGMAHATNWFEPRTSSPADVEAKYRLLDFQLGWLMHPVTYGDYPPVMRSYVGNRLPKFSKEQSDLLKGSMDFVGLNYYTTNYAADNPYGNTVYNRSYTSDAHADFATHDENGNPICEPTQLFWLFICPKGIRDLMHYIKDKYKDPVMYITENGMADMAENIDKLPLEEALMDKQRVRYYRSHLWNIKAAIKDGIKVKGHFAWSFHDNFEWSSGYTVRFGVNYVDYKDDLRRYPKLSAAWYMKFLHGGRGKISMTRKSDDHPFSM